MLKNYTSQVPASTSLNQIERMLVKHGARQVLKSYDPDGRVESVCFIMHIGNDEVPFKLPARVAECERVLMGETSQRTRPETLKKIPAQAERTAWKILLDWVEAQMAMIELAQVEVMEVFLPYVYDPKSHQTFYEITKERGFSRLLPAGKKMPAVCESCGHLRPVANHTFNNRPLCGECVDRMRNVKPETGNLKLEDEVLL